MSFIKNLTEKLLEAEFRPITNFYNSSFIGDKTEYLGFVKQVGGIAYCIVVINADLKYDYQGFYKDALGYFKQLNRTITTGIFVSENVTTDLLNFADHTIDDYQESHIDIRWIADMENNRLIVNGSQPSKLLDIEKCIAAAFNGDSSNISQDIGLLIKKNADKNKSMLKSGTITLTLALIIINGIFEAITLYNGNDWFGNSIIYNGAINNDIPLTGQWYRLVTYMFLHGGLTHYTANALSLYIFGSRVERYYGKVSMMVLYLLSGIGAGLCSMTFNSGMAVGASGAISGLLASVLLYTRIRKRSIDGLDNYVMILFAIIGLCSGFMMPNVDNWGHIGGFVTGFMLSLIILLSNKQEKNNYDK